MTENNAYETSGVGSGAGLRAQVRTKDGWAVSHAVVTVTDLTGNQVARCASDEDGRVSGPALPQGTYTVIVTAVGYAPQASSAIVAPSGTAQLGTVTLARAGGTELPPPGVWTLDPVHSNISAVAQHLGLSSIHGRFTAFSGQVRLAEPIEESSLYAEIEAASIDTGNGMRDDHLRAADFLDVENHPLITFASDSVKVDGNDRFLVNGTLTIKGISQPVELELSYLGTGGDPWGGTRAACRATTQLHRDDFAMNYNQVVRAGIAAIGTTLRVELDIQAVQGSPEGEDSTA